MTPHDAWDYDGINEMVLTDSQVNGATVPTLTHFDRNGFTYLLDRRNGKLLKASKFDPTVNWAKEIDMATGRPVVDPTKMTKADVNAAGFARRMGAEHATGLYDPRPSCFTRATNHIRSLPGVHGAHKSGFPTSEPSSNIPG
jgi:hypothetical protein